MLTTNRKTQNPTGTALSLKNAGIDANLLRQIELLERIDANLSILVDFIGFRPAKNHQSPSEEHRQRKSDDSMKGA